MKVEEEGRGIALNWQYLWMVKVCITRFSSEAVLLRYINLLLLYVLIWWWWYDITATLNNISSINKGEIDWKCKLTAYCCSKQRYWDAWQQLVLDLVLILKFITIIYNWVSLHHHNQGYQLLSPRSMSLIFIRVIWLMKRGNYSLNNYTYVLVKRFESSKKYTSQCFSCKRSIFLICFTNTFTKHYRAKSMDLAIWSCFRLHDIQW